MTSDASVRSGLPPRVRRPFGILGHPLVQLTLVRVREFVAGARSGLLGHLLSDSAHQRTRHRVPEPSAGGAEGRKHVAGARRRPSAARPASPSRRCRPTRPGRRFVSEPSRSSPSRRPTACCIGTTRPIRKDGRRARWQTGAVQRAAGRTDPVAAGDALVREPGSRYIDFLVPGLVGLGIMSNAVWGIGFSIVDARRRKLTKRLVATPMSRTYYLASYLVWRMVILVFEVGLPIGFGALAFGVPVRGRLLDLAVICVFASVSFSALGLLIASPGPHDRSGLEPDEPAAGPDVDPVGRLLLGSAVSGRSCSRLSGPCR